MAENVLARSDGGWQGHRPGAVLQGQSLTSPRSCCLLGIVTGLVDLDPNVASAAIEVTAGTLAVGKVGHDCQSVSKNPIPAGCNGLLGWGVLTGTWMVTLPVSPHELDEATSLDRGSSRDRDIVVAVLRNVTGNSLGL